MHHTLDESVEELRERHGLDLPRSAVDRILGDHARSAAALCSSPEPVGSLPSKGARELVAEADGTCIRVVSSSPGPDRRKTRKVEYKEMRLFAARAQGSAQARYAGGFVDMESAGNHWARCALLAGWGADTHVHGCFDGAQWISLRFDEQFGERGDYLIDFFHLCEYLGAASQSYAQPETWFAEQRRRLRDSRIDEIVAELECAKEPEDRTDEQSPVRAALRYIQARREHLFYKQALQRGLPIGSGMIESGHKHVLHKKLRVPGAWNEEKAHGIAQLRIARKNNKWNQFWDQQAQRKAA